MIYTSYYIYMIYKSYYNESLSREEAIIALLPGQSKNGCTENIVLSVPCSSPLCLS